MSLTTVGRSAIDLPEHDVERADDRRSIGQHRPAAQEIHRLQMGERRRPDLALVGPVGAVRHQVDAELALGRLDRGIDLARGHVMALAVELEMVNGRLHRALHLGAQGRHDLVVLDGNRPPTFGQPQLLQALFHDAHRLAHLLHADTVAVVIVSVLADRDVEIELGIALVGLRFAQVPGGTGAAHHHARETPSPGVGERNYADVHVALFEDAIVSEQTLDIVAHLQEWVAERLDIVDQFWRKVLMYAADSEIGRMHAATRGTLIEYHQLLALLEPPQRWGERAHVHGLGGDIEQMRKQPSDFAIEDADELRAARDRDAQKLFRRQAERMLLVHRRDIVEAVEIRGSL